MADIFSKHYSELNSPVRHGEAITPHDTNELAHVPRYIYVGGAGDVSVILAGDTVAVTLKAVPVGTVLPLRAKIVKSTGTTSTFLIALY